MQILRLLQINLFLRRPLDDLATLYPAALLEETVHVAGRCGFSLDALRGAVALNAGRARLEASGGVDLKTVRGIAETGVDDISVGGLTKDLEAVDLSMRFV